ncbi:toxin-antitoxin system YwqK family antitoxin [Psychroserpens sp. NJDZ02]|uniref:toxin-antitoxin system YwqK family antitoxin n=1 Tax=Psychroserpens sp. NJDZ02 TaxID=2570561 RepID=UPI0010A7C9D4|nr:hypothetical protein [Psychroserpens sp. NJDZ02]QCE43114.1 hypothetical protein E9099_17375 [Psychroserpens sp. NJDZ02]
MKILNILFLFISFIVYSQQQEDFERLTTSINTKVSIIDGVELFSDSKQEIIFNGKYKILITTKVADYTGINYNLGESTGYREQGTFSKGYKNSLWTTTYKNKLIKTENWKYGLIHGEYRVYDTIQKIQYRTDFGTGGNGEYKDYYKTGILKQEGNYQNGKKEGEWCTYDRQGKIIKTINYKKGSTINE